MHRGGDGEPARRVRAAVRVVALQRIRTTAGLCGCMSGETRVSGETTKVSGGRRRRRRGRACEVHGLCCGRRLVEQRRIRDVEARQVADHRLVVERRLVAAMARHGM